LLSRFFHFRLEIPHTKQTGGQTGKSCNTAYLCLPFITW